MNLQNQEQRLSLILDTSHDAFVGVNPNGQIIEWNQQAESIFGWSRAEALGQKMLEMIIPEKYRDAHHRGMQQFTETGNGKILYKRIQLEASRKDGEIFPMEMAITFLPSTKAYEFYAFIQDISERKKEEKKLLDLASIDILTGLKNRSHFNTALPEAMARCRRNKINMALLYLDIDHFKSINDNLGHEAGDNLLKEFSSRVNKVLREVDIICRLGGDEFSIIAEGVADGDAAEIVASNILRELNRGHWLKDSALKITSSIGIAIYDGRIIEADHLVVLADKAMYKAKHSGRNNFKLLRFEDVESSDVNKNTKDNLVVIKNTQQLLNITTNTDGDFLQNTLAALRRHLDMDVAFISHIHDGVREFKVVDAGDLNPPIAVGDSGPLEEGYCQRVIDGRLPEIINDAFDLPEAMSLPVTVMLPVRAHMSVPIRMSNGDVYGTFCCFSYKPNQTLNERDISVMHVFADLVSQQVTKTNSK